MISILFAALGTHVGQSHALMETSAAAAVQILNGDGKISAVNLSMANRHKILSCSWFHTQIV